MTEQVKVQIKLFVGNKPYNTVGVLSEILGFVKALAVFVIDAVKNSVDTVVNVLRALRLLKKLLCQLVVYLLFSVPPLRIVGRTYA